MKRSAALALAVGVALIGWLLASNDLSRIAGVLAGAGWGIALVVALHLPQTLLSGLAWGTLLGGRLRVGELFRLRFVREAVNALLPVAQVGGDVVRVRLAARRGVPAVTGTATTIVDVSVEMAAQALFTLMGVAALGAGGEALPVGIAAVAGIVFLTVLLLGAQRFGLFGLVERLAARAGGGMVGLGEAALALYRQPGRLARSGAEHLMSWLAGVVETWAALHVLGVPAGCQAALAIEALGQAGRAAGFLIPGALGVQEGGYLLICGLFGIAPEQALALSLVRRVRELALGLPGLLWWRWMERHA